MIVECPRCKKENDIGEANRDDCFCGECYAPLRDETATVEHNRREIEKLKWQTKPSNS